MRRKETEDDDTRFLVKVAQYSAEQYPNHPYAFNDVALFYSVAGDNVKTREWLEKAHKVDPKDTLVLVNLGQVAERHGRYRCCWNFLQPGNITRKR